MWWCEVGEVWSAMSNAVQPIFYGIAKRVKHPWGWVPKSLHQESRRWLLCVFGGTTGRMRVPVL